MLEEKKLALACFNHVARFGTIWMANAQRFLNLFFGLQDGSVNLKLNLNYGVDRGTIVAVGPSSCFGSDDIHKGMFSAS